MRDLLLDPCWSAKDLGHALPDSPHAVSVALPRWEDVINYEEKNTACLNALRTIYPRFGLNPLVAEVARIALKSDVSNNLCAWPFPNRLTAERAQNFCQLTNDLNSTYIKKVLGLYCLLTDERSSLSAKAFWQHTGLGGSSRLAAIALKKELPAKEIESKIAKESLIKRIASIYNCNEQLVGLHPSGMAALFTALESIKKLFPEKKTVQIGFPYVDVLKLPQVIFQGGELIIESKIENLISSLNHIQASALIIEIPSNPMLQCVDLPAIAKEANKRGIPVIVDDTIGSGINIDAIDYADMIFTSLTKSFAGRGDILAGSLVISPQSKWKEQLKVLVKENSLAPLANADAIELEKSSRDFKERIRKLNLACLKLKNRLEKHPAVKRVFHPETCPNFKKIMRQNGGYGCLLSFELKEGLTHAMRFYDSIKVCKGPSLGTNFTLVCPYVLLAHYKELSWAEGCGVPPHLLRVSVGLEDSNVLWRKFEEALQK